MSGIPVYNQACLATDSTSSVPSFYLVGSTSPGSLEVNYVNNPDATTVTQVASQNDQSSWSPSAAKLCYIYPFATSVNPGIKIVQFGAGSTYMGLAQTNNLISGADSFNMTGFVSPKLFAWSGKFQDFDMFTIVTNDTDTTTLKVNMWAALRMNFRQNGPSLITYDMVNNPVDVNNAMLAVGTYGGYSGNASQGYTVVFDKSSRGQIFTAQGNLLADITNFTPTVALGVPTNVITNGITLTINAIPVTMGNTAYILDRASNGSTVIYSINPSASFTLNRVYKTGDSLPFTNNMAAGALNNQILTYSVNRSAAFFNVFDLTTHSWSGNGLVSAPVIEPVPTNSSNIGVIACAAVGSLVLILLAVVFFVRRRCKSAKKPAGAGVTALAQNDLETSKFDNSADQGHNQHGQGYIQYDPRQSQYLGHVQYDHGQPLYGQEQVQYEQLQTQYDQGQALLGQGQAQYDQGYVPYDPACERPTSFIPPPPPVNQLAEGVHNAYLLRVAGDSPESKTAYSPYANPTSTRVSTFSPENPESMHAKTQRTSVGQDPQYFPADHFSSSEARSPQARQ
ncbi:hypothetical protein BGZ95_009239 [Linnemannia exigua]|uniref:Uncharacterized protein n=1 Tax=Linnemannia exigua TaxID=604196 RepID=A0AAD4H6W5_9FUNG|nr:hypothetical protein BGZ95_009239 [Linnemannia exigua]